MTLHILTGNLVAAAVLGSSVLTCSGPQSTKPTFPAPMDFEQVDIGELPDRWAVTTPGWEGRVVADATGKNKFLLLTHMADQGPGFGNFMTRIKGRHVAGKTVEIKARLQAVTSDSQAQMWARVDRVDDQRGFFDNMDDRPVMPGDWKTVSMRFDVAKDAEALCFGFINVGRGEIAVDDIDLRILD